MQAFPLLLFAVIGRLPESPRWFIYHGRNDLAADALMDIWGPEKGEAKAEELLEQHEREKGANIGYLDMIRPGSTTFHPTVITVMGQINQALTGYGAVSVYGPQIFEVSHLSCSTAYVQIQSYWRYACADDTIPIHSCWGSLSKKQNTSRKLTISPTSSS
jgi:hypothetical protein